MPVTSTRLEAGLYHVQISGSYTDQELLEMQAQHIAAIEASGDRKIIGIAEIVGELAPTRNLSTMQTFTRMLDRYILLIVVNYPLKRQIVSGAINRSAGVGDKVLFMDSMEDALRHARKVLREQARTES